MKRPGAHRLSSAERRSRPGLLGWYFRRRYRFVLRQIGSPAGWRVVDLGGGTGIFADLLLERGAASVVVIERRPEACEEGARLHPDQRIQFVRADLLDRLDLLAQCDTVTSLRCLHQVGPGVHEIFQAIQKSPARRVVLQGVESLVRRLQPEHTRELWGPRVAQGSGLVELVERYGFRAELRRHPRYPVVIGSR